MSGKRPKSGSVESGRSRGTVSASIVCFAVMLAAAVISRLCGYYQNLASTDVLLMYTAVPVLLYYASGLFDIIVLFVGYGAVTFFVSARGPGRSVPAIAAAAAATAANYVIVLILNYAEYGSSINYWALLKYLGYNCLSELARLAIIVAAAALIRHIYLKKDSSCLKSKPTLLPFRSVYSRCSLFAAAITLAGRAVVELTGEILPYIDEVGYLSQEDVMTVIITYLMMILTCLAGYLVSYLVQSILFRRFSAVIPAWNN
ncbi:MAG: hypothetical protein J6128_03740 [Clostridia bacterium]|nr:hypothetical protein [Clostridia bacterium]